MPNDYVNLKNLQGVEIKPITDLAAINLTEVNGIAVEGNTIGIQDGYIESAYYTEMVDPTVGPAASSSAYVEGGTIYTLLGGYAVTSAINTASPSQQKVPSEAAVVSAFDDIVVSGASYYAGTGINIDAGHTVSVANVPTSAVAGLDTQLTGISASVAGKQDAISAGYRMELSGTTLSQARYFPIESPTSATITLQAGHAYKIQATAGSKTLTAETIPANQFGLEGHAEIFIANTGLIKTTSSVFLANALKPDAVNNCTVRFHDGYAIISVEDHIAGYIVMVNATSGSGSLNYALGVSTEYISVDASLNGQTLDLAGAVTNGEKHVVGNGYTETIISGGINCTSKTTLSNLAADGVIVSSGTLTLGDVYIPSGATVSVSGGGLAVEKVTGNGGTIDLGGTNVTVPSGATASACTFVGGSGSPNGGAFRGDAGTVVLNKCTVTSCYANNGGAILASSGSLTSCVISGNSALYYGGGLRIANLDMANCTITGNTAGYGYGGGGVCVAAGNTANATSCIVSGNVDRMINNTDVPCDYNVYGSVFVDGGTVGTIRLNGGTVSFAGIVCVDEVIPYTSSGSGGFVTLASGTTLDLSGNTNATPINPGGSVIVNGSCQVITSAGTTVSIAGGTYTKINNDGTTN